MNIQFDPAQETFWFPRGAVRIRTGCTLTVQTDAAAAALLLRKDGAEAPERLPMEKTPEGFSLFLDQSTPGLWFFSFLLTDDAGREYRFFSGENGLPREKDDRPDIEWPVLFYAADFETPDWTTGGLLYQIFPDRFARDGLLRTEGVKNQRSIHYDLCERPQFTMDVPDYNATDFYGGNLPGIISRIPYLAGLGVTALYLNPIFEAASNHRYNTGDYLKIDPMLGTEEDFTALCDTAHKNGMKVILDGVFSHTGSDSRYFNKEGHYDSVGAYQSPDSPYASWYSFGATREDYACWWNFKTLPNVNETDPSYLSFICGENGVLRSWLRKGADGWRLDVADELPDDFLTAVRVAVKAEKPDALLLGEVWEDAALKFSYGARRAFLQGRQLDSVMNYPFRNALIDCILQKDARLLADAVNRLMSHYPAPCLSGLMNMLSTHDTWRILNVFGVERTVPPEQMADDLLSPLEYEQGCQRLRRAVLLQYFLPGMPSIYYGDEVGLSGYGDPWNRRFFPWERAYGELPAFFAAVGRLRRENKAFFSGKFEIAATGREQLTLSWTAAAGRLTLTANFGTLPLPLAKDADLLFSLGSLTEDKSEAGCRLLGADSMALWRA